MLMRVIVGFLALTLTTGSKAVKPISTSLLSRTGVTEILPIKELTRPESASRSSSSALSQGFRAIFSSVLISPLMVFFRLLIIPRIDLLKFTITPVFGVGLNSSLSARFNFLITRRATDLLSIILNCVSLGSSVAMESIVR